MASEIWFVTSQDIDVTYTPNRPPNNIYPVSILTQLSMPEAFNPSAPNHNVNPVVTPFLQGFNIQYGDWDHPTQHWIRQLKVQVASGWDPKHLKGGPGPYLNIIVGLRDNSGGDPPDDSFVAKVHASVVVVFPE